MSPHLGRFTGLLDPNDYSYSFNPCKPYIGEYSCTNIHVSSYIPVWGHNNNNILVVEPTNRSARLQISTQPKRMILLTLELNKCGWTLTEHHTFTTQDQVMSRGKHYRVAINNAIIGHSYKCSILQLIVERPKCFFTAMSLPLSQAWQRKEILESFIIM